MNADEALDQIDRLLRVEAAAVLNPKRAIFRGAWEGLTYQNMILQWRREYDLSYIKAQGSELCKHLTQVLGVRVKKLTFREDVLEGLKRRSRYERGFVTLEITSAPLAAAPALHSVEIRWAGPADLVEKLVQRLLDECRLLKLVERTDIGKTALAARLFADRSLHSLFPIVKGLCLDRAAPSLERLATEILGPREMVSFNQHPDKLIAAMVARLQTQPCLLVLDLVDANWTVDRKGTPISGFDRFLEQIIRADAMPSRIILTLQERLPSVHKGGHGPRSQFA